ncbi:GGDEF/EAL domain-containing response regulator [Vulcaniibacterium tengchongense]|uniref:Diguanylate cyclase/phosphodiesterase n=1 Tax=Vulcaniibacterium tengchongense TaxID=1273429 RepID=A0A3N4VS65_9GAMM|nr:EAL domain-containing protein [Vulcaniibacterium tengchongense]RPE82051.1 diguanylate cyclase/phosphodiesterase [Vulcaniibacterium tengchongense]
MQFGKDTALRLLIVDDSVEAAEAIVSGLRNGGIAVRPSRPESEADLPALVGQQPPPDLVLAAHDARNVPLHKVMQCVDASGKDLPVLVVLDAVDEERLLEALALGARDVVLRGRPEHIESRIRAEWADLEARRALRRLEAQVRETERRCDALIESSREPIAYIHEGMHIRANAAYLEIFGFRSFDEIEGMSLLDLIAPQKVEGFKHLLKQIARGEAPPRHETEARALDGGHFAAVMEFTPASYEGEACLQVILRRQEIDPELAREVEALRQRDQVTGLLNRATFLRTLEDAVADAAQNAAQHGLLLVEPDHYTRLLQDIGLDAADALIAAFAQRLRTVLGPDDIAARFAEHQFAVLARNSDHLHTTGLAETLRAAFADHVLEIDSHSLNATVSIGGVQISEKIASLGAVLGKASQCVQSASGVGGNRSELFDPGAADRAEEERVEAWVARIRDALDADRFVMEYQPLIGLHGEPVEMYEAYLRLQGEHGELVQPLTFLQIAEEHGLLWEIDRWVVGKAIAIIGERQRAGRRTTLLVKITQASLQDDSLQRFIHEQLARHGADGRLLVLQLPESKVFTHLRAAQELQARVASAGVRVGLEQFGVGLNSFQLLSHFDATFLKIDRSFAQDLPNNPEHQRQIREIADKARELGRMTIAEFVQDAASMTILFSAGIDYAQGNFLAPPGPAMDYEFP